jgi:CheY-like chemotaxis protein
MRGQSPRSNLLAIRACSWGLLHTREGTTPRVSSTIARDIALSRDSGARGGVALPLPFSIRMLNVLIADDEDSVVELVRVTLEDERVRVIVARDGMTALALADEVAPDLLLLDVNMPGHDGVEVCRRLRADDRFARTPIVMLTAAARPEDVRRGLEAGATEYLTKPFSPVRLLTLVDTLSPGVAPWQPR